MQAIAGPHSKLDHHAGYTGTWDLRLGKYKPTSQSYILIKDHHTGLIINAHQKWVEPHTCERMCRHVHYKISDI